MSNHLAAQPTPSQMTSDQQAFALVPLRAYAKAMIPSLLPGLPPIVQVSFLLGGFVGALCGVSYGLLTYGRAFDSLGSLVWNGWVALLWLIFSLTMGLLAGNLIGQVINALFLRIKGWLDGMVEG